MKPKSPFIQPFEELPDELPIYAIENALLPGGELPLELSESADLAMFINALRTDQLIGMVQLTDSKQQSSLYKTGCAGRIRQYRERKDGRLNIMLTGLCRYEIVEELPLVDGYRHARVDWSNYENDYQTEEVDESVVTDFKATLRNYFDRHNMQVDWKVLDKLPIEQIVNNLVLVMNLSIENKQQLLESPTVTERLALFSGLLEQMVDPIRASTAESERVN
jgi:uncharacterized protein